VDRSARWSLIAAVALVVTGCGSPAGSAVLSDAPTIPPLISSPSASTCSIFDLTRESEPAVALHRAGESERDEVGGLNGSGVLDGHLFDAGPWHQPAPGQALVVSRGQSLVIRSFLDSDIFPICLASVVVDAAPFSPIAAVPDPSALVRLVSIGGNDTGLASFPAPSDPGEWIVRVVLAFPSSPGPSRQESFFRLRVDTSGPAVAGKATAPIPCSSPGANPPRAFLSVDGGSWIPAERGSFTWGSTAGDGPPPAGPRVDIEHGATLRVRIEHDVCASWWSVGLAVHPRQLGDYEQITDLVVPRPSYGDPGAANRFRLDAVPPGDWVIGGFFEFGESDATIQGQTTNFWNVVVHERQ
jgi:hypothetical protein